MSWHRQKRSDNNLSRLCLRYTTTWQHSCLRCRTRTNRTRPFPDQIKALQCTIPTLTPAVAGKLRSVQMLTPLSLLIPIQIAVTVQSRPFVVQELKQTAWSPCWTTIPRPYNWAHFNLAAIWLRPQWYLVINSVLTDIQSGGLTFVTGGGYTEFRCATRPLGVGLEGYLRRCHATDQSLRAGRRTVQPNDCSARGS